MSNKDYDGVFGEFIDEDMGKDAYRRTVEIQRRVRAEKRKNSLLNEVGVVPLLEPEIIARREKYREDFISLHADVFPDSTGLKPFGEQQQRSIRMGHQIFVSGGRLVKLEPRGYAKTTRITNEALAAVLLGMQDYIVIVCSNSEKAQEILDSIRTEIYNNENLEELFPGPIACYKHLDDTPQKARYQTYGGEKTYVYWGTRTLRFPVVPNEPSSGKFIEIRPMSNTKGLHKKIKAGPDAGKVIRPTLFLIDDPQTHDDAKSETNVRTIISRIKRDALRGGSHSKRASAIMSITPVCAGDVAWHFLNNEHAWEYTKYKMMETFPEEHDWWMNEYSKVYLDYDRTVLGDKIRAAIEAKKLVEANYERVHKGAVVTWDHAFAWDEDPQTEISPVQHAYNIILDDGWEDFEFECQCNTEYGTYEEGEHLNATPKQICSKTLPYKRLHVPQDTRRITCHIDVNKDILTYAILATPDPLRPHVIAYGTHPKQPGLWNKRNITCPLGAMYPHCVDHRDVLYLAVKDLIEILVAFQIYREDGMLMNIDRIGIDCNYEEVYVTRAIIESIYRNVCTPCRGIPVSPDEPLLHEVVRSRAMQVFNNCYLESNRDNTMDVLQFDTNFFKTEVHRGFNLETGMKGSLTIYGKDSDGDKLNFEYHEFLANHCNAEVPKRETGKKKGKTKVTWKERRNVLDNEFFDNITGSYALFAMEGISTEIDPSRKVSRELKKDDIAFFMRQQNNKLDL